MTAFSGFVGCIFFLSMVAIGDLNAATSSIENHEYTDVCPVDASTGKKQNCGIKKLFFQVENHNDQASNNRFPYYGTVLRAGFEADTWANLQKFGFVQYIRGCTYASKLDAKGGIQRRVAEAIHHLGEPQTFAFPNWAYDANTTDPLYYGPIGENALLKGGRLALYRWTPLIGEYARSKTMDLYQVLALPKSRRDKMTPRLFVIDAPAMAYFSESGQHFNNVALEFKLCLYKLADIPMTISDHSVLSTPLFCYDWNSQFEFDFVQNKFLHVPDKGLDAFCATQIAENPANVWRRESGATTPVKYK